MIFSMLTKQDKKYIDDKFESFAIMIQKGFEACVTKTEFHSEINDLKSGMKAIDDRLDGVEGRLECVEGRLECVESKLSDVDDRLTSIEHKNFHAPNRRLDKVEDDIRVIKTKVGLV